MSAQRRSDNEGMDLRRTRRCAPAGSRGDRHAVPSVRRSDLDGDAVTELSDQNVEWAIKEVRGGLKDSMPKDAQSAGDILVAAYERQKSQNVKLKALLRRIPSWGIHLDDSYYSVPARRFDEELKKL